MQQLDDKPLPAGVKVLLQLIEQDDAAKTVLPAARAGHDDGYVDSVRVVWSDTERGRGPTGTAIRTGAAVIARNREGSGQPQPTALLLGSKVGVEYSR